VVVGRGSSSVGPIAAGGSLRLANQAPNTFTISGSVAGLYPGLSRPLVLTVTNPKTFAIVVTSITTAVQDAGPACTTSSLSVGAFSGQLAVPGSGSATTAVVAGLSLTAPDACSGATFSLVYSGVARRP
jgi:hypothetical protein